MLLKRIVFNLRQPKGYDRGWWSAKRYPQFSIFHWSTEDEILFMCSKAIANIFKPPVYTTKIRFRIYSNQNPKKTRKEIVFIRDPYYGHEVVKIKRFVKYQPLSDIYNYLKALGKDKLFVEAEFLN